MTSTSSAGCEKNVSTVTLGYTTSNQSVHNSSIPFNASANIGRNWQLDIALAWSLTLLSVYLVISLSINEHRRFNKPITWSGYSFSQQVIRFLSQGTLCLISATLILVRCLAEQIDLWRGYDSDLWCLVYQHLSVCLFELAALPVYILLWARQKKIYKNPGSSHLITVLTRFISTSSVIGITVCGITSIAFGVYFFDLSSSVVGCVYNHKVWKEKGDAEIPIFISTATNFFFKVLLLFLFVYPLFKEIKESCHQRTKSMKRNPSRKHVSHTMRRLCISIAVCIALDLITSISFAMIYDFTNSVLIWSLMYNVNSMLRLLAVIGSFSDWKLYLFPFGFKPAPRRRKRVNSAVSSNFV